MNNLMTNKEMRESIARNFSKNPEVWDIVTDECFERMKKYMNQEDIIKAIELRNKILLDTNGK